MITGTPDLLFHHVGVACPAIENEALRLQMLGYRPEGPAFVDSVQGVRGLFVVGPGPRLELLEPMAVTGVLTPWLAQGVKLYHLAYEVHDLRGALARLREQRAKLVVSPVSAVAFGGREIAFLMLPNRLLVELIAMELADGR